MPRENIPLRLRGLSSGEGNVQKSCISGTTPYLYYKLLEYSCRFQIETCIIVLNAWNNELVCLLYLEWDCLDIGVWSYLDFYIGFGTRLLNLMSTNSDFTLLTCLIHWPHMWMVYLVWSSTTILFVFWREDHVI